MSLLKTAFLQPRLLQALPRPAVKWVRLFTIAVLVGVVSGLATAAVEFGLHNGSRHIVGRIVNPGMPAVLDFHWPLLVLPALGGLLSGLLIRFFCPTAVGHGTETLVRAFHHQGGALPLRGPAVKALAAIGVISSGGSAGPEGPVAALGAAIGSSMGGLFTLTPRERRIMLVAGCGAGIGAIFQSPMGGALFAASVMYREPDFESEAIVPAFIASVIGYSTYMPFYGMKFPLLGGATGFHFRSPYELIPYAVLGVVCAGYCILLHMSLSFVERRPLRAFHLPRWLAPAVGGLATGAIACVIPQVMDWRYDFINNAMSGVIQEALSETQAWHPVLLFAGVGIAKCLATGFTVGSGASGGLLGPSVFIGGAAGAFVGVLFEALWPGAFPPSTRLALVPVGMAGVLSATMRSPLAAIVMAAEMTGSYGLFVPSMLVCVSSYVIGRRWGLNREQLGTAADSPTHAGDTIVHMLENWHVRDFLQHDWAQTIAPDATLREIVSRVQPGTRPVFAVVDGRRIVGIVSLPDIEEIMSDEAVSDAVIAADIMNEDISTVHPDDDVYYALTRMARNNHIVMPVVSRGDSSVYLGMFARNDVYDRVRQQMEKLRKDLLAEHTGLAAIEHEEQLHQLVMGVSTPKRDMIQRLLVPMQVVGQSLREADFRRRFGVQVIAVEQPDGSMQCPPDPDAPLRTNQRLVAIVFERPETEAPQPDADTD